MPRARNEHTDQAIISAAWKLFFEKGFAQTSYTDLSVCSGISRPLVQRYFPRKELLVERCVREMWSASARACDERFSQDIAPLARLYLLGQVSVATYFACEGIRKFMQDVFSDRDLTLRTIEEGFDWTVSRVLPGHPKIARGNEPDEHIMVMGGLYELIYVYLTRGDMLDVAACTLPCIVVFGRMFDMGVSKDELRTYALDRAQLDQLAHRALELVAW